MRMVLLQEVLCQRQMSWGTSERNTFHLEAQRSSQVRRPREEYIRQRRHIFVLQWISVKDFLAQEIFEL